jgi:uncharacterized protein
VSEKIILGTSLDTGKHVTLLSALATRHGIITGATGTGKTVTLQLIAEKFVNLGTTVIIPDIKGDVSGLAKPGINTPETIRRLVKAKLDPSPTNIGNPTILWKMSNDEVGHPLKTTFSELGPLLVAKALDLNDIQTGVCYILFDIADKEGLLLLNSADFESLLTWVTDNRKFLEAEFGGLSTSTLSAIRRKLNAFLRESNYEIFGEPAVSVNDLINSSNPKIHIISASQCLSAPKTYTTMLLWLLSELFELLPEVGETIIPKCVFFFDEAHLIFSEGSSELMQKVENLVRLIRSRGVSVFFITQRPTDIPDSILSQLGTRVHHALRAYTQEEREALRNTARSLVTNPSFNSEEALTKLGIGEALISVLNEKAIPEPVQRTLLLSPLSKIGPLNESERQEIVNNSEFKERYEKVIDRESAFEMLAKRRTTLNADVVKDEPPSMIEKFATSTLKGVMQSFMRNVTSRVGREIFRGILGTITSSRK